MHSLCLVMYYKCLYVNIHISIFSIQCSVPYYGSLGIASVESDALVIRKGREYW